jgi:hypothetical protein
MSANSDKGFRTSGKRDAPGGGYKRNFNRNPSGKLKMRMARSKHSRSKSRG